MIAVVSFAAFASTLAAAADQDRVAGDGMFIATTGRIVMIDLKNRTLRVRGSGNEGVPMFVKTKSGPSSMITLPGGLTIHIPRRVDRIPPKTTAGALPPNEYTVIVTSKTLIQDGAESVRLEDFREGETISIHGVFKGNTLTASKIAKWSA